MEKTLSIPAFAFSHMELVKSHSFMDLQLSDSENHYPILLFSHGFNGFRNQNTFQVEELASQGYIVLSIDHTLMLQLPSFQVVELLTYSPSI